MYFRYYSSFGLFPTIDVQNASIYLLSRRVPTWYIRGSHLQSLHECNRTIRRGRAFTLMVAFIPTIVYVLTLAFINILFDCINIIMKALSESLFNINNYYCVALVPWRTLSSRRRCAPHHGSCSIKDFPSIIAKMRISRPSWQKGTLYGRCYWKSEKMSQWTSIRIQQSTFSKDQWQMLRSKIAHFICNR